MSFWLSDSRICTRCGVTGSGVRLVSGHGLICDLCLDSFSKGLILSISTPFHPTEIEAKFLSLNEAQENSMTKKSSTPPAAAAVVIDPVEALRSLVERLPRYVGTLAYDEAADAARRELESRGAAAFSEIFPPHFKPEPEHILREVEIAILGAPGSELVGSSVSYFAAAHDQSVVEHPDLAAAFRSLRVRKVISKAVTAYGEARAGAIAMAKFERAVCLQLQRHGLFRPACDVVLEVQSLRARIDELTKQHADQLAAEDLERRRQAKETEAAKTAELEAAEAKADEARLRAEWSPEDRARRENLARLFERQQGFVFPVDGVNLSAVACAARVRRGGEIAKFHGLLGRGIWHTQAIEK